VPVLPAVSAAATSACYRCPRNAPAPDRASGRAPRGNCGEQDCPYFCMFCEAACLPGCAVTATRFVLMDHYAILPDECDNRVIRFNNCIQVRRSGNGDCRGRTPRLRLGPWFE
jgi:hypothetical protein